VIPDNVSFLTGNMASAPLVGTSNVFIPLIGW
jgi:hypothetical protein